MATGDYVIVTAQNSVNTTQLQCGYLGFCPIYQYAQNDSFDNALGNRELTSNWERGTVAKDPDGNRYLTQNLQALPGDWQYLTDSLDNHVYGKGRIKFKFQVGDVANTKIAARTWATSEQF